jgi:ribosomal-protein-alanine N-acetyltransferase
METMRIKLDCPLYTDRLILRRPESIDALAVFENFASDNEVVKYMSWAKHTKITDAETFIRFSKTQWEKQISGTYLITIRDTGRVIGSTGISFETKFRASTGYVLSRDSWGFGYATEALTAIVKGASAYSIHRLFAYCHSEHSKSAHVLEKCGFELEGTMRRYIEFPNLTPGVASDVLLYARVF